MISPRHERDDAPHVWLATGHEGYGSAATIEAFGEGVFQRGGVPTLVSLFGGPFADRLQGRGWRVIHVSHAQADLAMVRPPWMGRWGALHQAHRLSGMVARVVPHLRASGGRRVLIRRGELVALAAKASRRAGLQAIWYPSGSLPGGGNGWMSRAYYRHWVTHGQMGIIANSTYTKRTLGSMGKDIPVVYPPIDLAPFLAIDPEAPGVSRDDATRRFGIFGRLIDRKGQREFIEAFDRVIRDVPDLELLLVGGGSPRFVDMLREMARNSSRPDRIHFQPRREDVAAAMASVDVVAAPSVLPESFGRVCVEAQAVGRPVLSTNLGGPCETVRDGETGWLMDPTVDAMEAGIRRALGDSDRWSEMGANGRAWARSRFSGEVQIGSFLDHVGAL